MAGWDGAGDRVYIPEIDWCWIVHLAADPGPEVLALLSDLFAVLKPADTHVSFEIDAA
jgi:uncharacterized protein YmfQ (DUF2313 family)